MSDNTALLQALQAIQQQLQQQSQQLQQQSQQLQQQLQQQSQQQIEQNTKILEALNIREQPKRDNSRYGSSSDEEEEEKYFELMDIPEYSQVKYVAYKLRGAASSWWDNLQTGRRRQRKQPIRTWRKMKRTIDEAVRIALKAEQTIKKQGIGSSMYKTKTDIIQSNSSQSGGDAQVDHSKSTHEVDGGKKKTSTTTTSTHAINKSSINPYARPVGNKCFKCQEVGHTSNQCRATKRVNLAEDDDDHSEAFLGLVRRLVLASTKKSKDSQRHNIFQTRCKINQEAFNVIVDGGSSENIISRDIVTRLKLTPKRHPKPYKIGWIKDVGEVRVTEQCEVLFAMGKYKDTVLFDIVDMDCHVLLGRPWQSNLNVVHKGKENTYTFSKGGRKFTLCPYSDEVQATTTKEKKNQIMLYVTRNKDKNICVTTIPPDQVLNPIRNSWSSSFQEGENDGGPELGKKEKG
ncbi:putative receptor protein kinase ZmPK1 [Tanacetum coccineum]|uniref:Receptor protein kinase ZmPK1 n=1 Tax=Tanacetum coccineum TaxID=301880 RepID=A0ABQ4Z885_9ASTR